jgi:TonB family protein
VIEPKFIRWESHPAYDWTVKGYPGDGRRCEITKQDWEELRNVVDEKTLAAFKGRKGCPACVDQAETWAWLEFSDGSKKIASYSFSNPPAPIASLLRKMDNIANKCPSEMVMIGGGGKPVPYASEHRKPTKVVEPMYAESAKASGIHGNVVVTLIVGKNGEVETVTAASGNEKLRTAAIDAVQQWKWDPLLLNGEPVRFRTSAVVHFVFDTNKGVGTDK